MDCGTLTYVRWRAYSDGFGQVCYSVHSQNTQVSLQFVSAITLSGCKYHSMPLNTNDHSALCWETTITETRCLLCYKECVNQNWGTTPFDVCALV